MSAPHAPLPPQALPLEEAVLGAIILDREALPAVIDILRPESFYLPAHQEIMRSCIALFAKNNPIDLLTVSQHLREAGKIETVGGSYYLTELSNRITSTANIEYHARIIAQKALLRDLIHVSHSTINKAYEESTDAFDLLYQTQKATFDMANFSGRGAMHTSQVSVELLRQIEVAMRKGDGLTGVPSGINALDRVTGGYQDTDLIVLAARPGMGKTSFVLCNALHAAKAGFPVGIFSLEMGRTQLMQRLVSMESGISSGDIRRGNLSDLDFLSLSSAIQAISALPIYIDDTPGLNIFELRAKARRLSMQHGVQLVIVDYLQLMSGSDEKKGGNREQEISAISRGLKTIAKELDVPVIALSQLSRAVETRGGAKRPQLSDLRESGAIEQDADIVGFLYRPEYYDILEDENGTSTKGRAELLIEKHRNGALETIGMRFDGPTTSFSDVSSFTPDTQFPSASGQSISINRPSAVEEEDVPF